MTRLIVYNIEYCEGMQGHWYEYLQIWKTILPPKNLDIHIIDELRHFHPDILALVEVDAGSIRSKKKDEAFIFKKQLGFNSLVEKVKYPTTSWLRLYHHLPILSKQSNAILAKQKITDVKYHMLNEGTKRVVIEATIHCPHKTTLLLAHLALGKTTRQKQLRELINIVNSIENSVILMGDFNTFSGEEEITELLAKTHLKHEYKKGNNHQTFTEPAFHPTKRLDYILTSKQIKVENYEVLDFTFSDHRPVMIDFKIEN